jgi:hypothetical protein
MRAWWCIALAAMVVACGGEEPSGAPEPFIVGDSGTGGSSGSAGAVGNDAAAGQPSLHASFVVESAPGKGAAMISLVNQTQFVMSMWVEQAVFFGVLPGSGTGPDLAISSNLIDDTTFGRHTSQGTCVQFRLKTLQGVAAMQPGKYYSATITFDDYDGFMADVSEVPGNGPYMALRAEISDPATGSFKPSELAVDLSGQRHRAYFQTYDKTPTSYVYAGAERVVIRSLSLTDRSGRRHVSERGLELEGDVAYTIKIEAQPVASAAASVALYAE